uniref:Uncharacterized protein LOC100179680 n=1 Tax=Phallusia mammillata TaxID=59560 RepID=A0A6F9DGD1_9ASCI|nr:uncharacterized protein LOC100179680 [Phallusia mammillata]
MPPTQSDEPYENVAVGVKDLFETYENALLPVDVQLQKFKRRDLYTSHFHRTSCKVFGPRKHVRKVHFVDGNPFDQENKEDSFDDKAAGDIVLPSYYAKLKPLKEKQKVQEDSVIHSEVQDHKSWVEKRKKLRSDLNQLGLDAAWLKRKPERTALEECVLNRLLNESGQEKALNKSLPPSPSEKNLRLLPVNVKCILKQLGRYMKANNFLATDIFPTDDMTISSEACREGLDTVSMF